METTFENAQVGDKVWDEYYQEYGEVVLIHSKLIEIRFKGRGTTYYKDGVMYGAHCRSLYWDKLVIPERPKCKVKKVIEGWYNIYPDSGLYLFKSRADERALPSRLGKAHFIHHEYEVEE